MFPLLVVTVGISTARVGIVTSKFYRYNLILDGFFQFQIFDGNSDGINGKRNVFDGQKLFARCLRIHPNSWTGGCSMRVDVVTSNEGKVTSSYKWLTKVGLELCLFIFQYSLTDNYA